MHVICICCCSPARPLPARACRPYPVFVGFGSGFSVSEGPSASPPHPAWCISELQASEVVALSDQDCKIAQWMSLIAKRGRDIIDSNISCHPEGPRRIYIAMEIGQRCRGPAIGGAPTPAMDRPRTDAGLASSGSTWRPNPFPAFRLPEPLESDRAADQSIVVRSPSMRSSSSA
eukprot:9467764-Pyramimonas_sp.AAC.1